MEHDTLSLGEYDTEDEAGYAYNVAMLSLYPDTHDSELNHGMVLTAKQKYKVEEQVKLFLILGDAKN